MPRLSKAKQELKSKFLKFDHRLNYFYKIINISNDLTPKELEEFVEVKFAHASALKELEAQKIKVVPNNEYDAEHTWERLLSAHPNFPNQYQEALKYVAELKKKFPPPAQGGLFKGKKAYGADDFGEDYHYPGGYGGSYSHFGSYVSGPACTHKHGQEVFSFVARNGAHVRIHAGAYSHVSNQHYETIFDLADGVTLGGIDLRGKVSERLKSWAASASNSTLVKIKWPDFSVPKSMSDKHWRGLATMLADGEMQDVYVCCFAGHGRTGTFLSVIGSLLTDQESVTAIPEGEDPVAWVRKNYCARAVESSEQIKYVEAVTLRKVSASPSKEGGSSKTNSKADSDKPSKGETVVSVMPLDDGSWTIPDLKGDPDLDVFVLLEEEVQNYLDSWCDEDNLGVVDMIEKAGGTASILWVKTPSGVDERAVAIIRSSLKAKDTTSLIKKLETIFNVELEGILL